MEDSMPRLSAFKAYDIRGRVPLDLNLELVRQIGLAYAAEFVPKSVCIGYDMRQSSLDFSHVLASALQDGGADVTILGLCGTEEVYHAVFSQGFDGGIMITASHNPKDWNGLKLVTKNAVPVSSDTGLESIHQRILKNDLPLAIKRGNLEYRNFRDAYVNVLLSYVNPQKLLPLTLVGNAGNGCAGPVLEKLLPHLPCTMQVLHKSPDGSFPNGVPNPLLPENREETAKAVLAAGAAMGIAWDGDFDRCFFFDEKGRFIESYYIVGLLAKTLLKNTSGEKILHDTRLTWNTREVVEQAGGIPIEAKTGHAFMKERMRKENALYGGEMSAHHYFRNFCYCDSGMIAWLLVYALLSETGASLSSLVDERIKRFPASGEINRALEDPDAAIERVKSRYAKDALHVTFIDGLSIEYPKWRCNIRKSNTEALLRLNVESRGNAALMEKITQELLALMY